MSVWFTEQETVDVCGKSYVIVRLLGKGKGGYSYLAKQGDQQVVLKQIHHEPCDYYAFGNKIKAESHDYEKLQKAGIRIPKLMAIDFREERIVKEYIPGRSIFELVRDGKADRGIVANAGINFSLFGMAGLNLDARMIRGLARLNENEDGPDIKNQSFSVMLGWFLGR